MLIEPGRICIKKYGRDAGSRAVIVATEKDGTVRIISTDRPKERKCNPDHLEFLNEVIDVKNRETINKALGIKEKEARPQSRTAAKK